MYQSTQHLRHGKIDASTMAVYDVAPTLYEFAGVDPNKSLAKKAGVADDRRQLISAIPPAKIPAAARQLQGNSVFILRFFGIFIFLHVLVSVLLRLA